MEQIVEQSYFDGSQRQCVVTDVEVPFPEGHLIISRTDSKGIITFANPIFVEISGFEHDELIGAPHSLMRHPDMPKAAFKDLWDTVQSVGRWNGYVKNLRKDGAYYWVYATVVANVRDGKVVGYTSVRRKPARKKVEESIELYKTLT